MFVIGQWFKWYFFINIENKKVVRTYFDELNNFELVIKKSII